MTDMETLVGLCAHCGFPFEGTEPRCTGNRTTYSRGEKGLFHSHCVDPQTVDEIVDQIRMLKYYQDEHLARAESEQASADSYGRQIDALGDRLASGDYTNA